MILVYAKKHFSKRQNTINIFHVHESQEKNGIWGKTSMPKVQDLKGAE